MSDKELAALEGCMRLAGAANQPVSWDAFADIVRYVREAVAANEPPPAPTRGGPCDNCKTTGFTEDGLECSNCEGTGISP